MALISNSNTVGAEWTPAKGAVHVQVTGKALLLRANASGAPFETVGEVSGATILDNDVAGAIYKWAGVPVAVRADQ